jgi:rubrerythrin
LTHLFDKYGIPLPENEARSHIAEPTTPAEAFKAGIKGEIANIKMYNTFLKQDIPADVAAVFTALKKASEKHMTAFENGLRRLESRI